MRQDRWAVYLGAVGALALMTVGEDGVEGEVGEGMELSFFKRHWGSVSTIATNVMTSTPTITPTIVLRCCLLPS
jgi:hypothetical protein